MKIIRSPDVAEAPPQAWSNMKVANGYFHIAGMTGSGPKGEHPGDDMYIQAKSIFQKFKHLLEAAGDLRFADSFRLIVYGFLLVIATIFMPRGIAFLLAQG
ncbi:MAG: hypothetical protein Q8L13_15770 [Bradyrhizobium sp.]|uniref:RidA family protein n=1 Tax=Bradyrhizobium sp. TaxID=376 RepID=UPI00272FFBB7|nr:hypothetical protein [Bradyrhizobium sp.]MDP1867777.1 hypothetical protein [Bradyrhizobium sp.]